MKSGREFNQRLRVKQAVATLLLAAALIVLGSAFPAYAQTVSDLDATLRCLFLNHE